MLNNQLLSLVSGAKGIVVKPACQLPERVVFGSKFAIYVKNKHYFSVLTDLFNTVPASEGLSNSDFESFRHNVAALETDASMIDMNFTLLIIKSVSVCNLQGFEPLNGSIKKAGMNRLFSSVKITFDNPVNDFIE